LIDDCLAPPEGFAWSYEAIKRDIYEQNAVCNATFALENRGQDRLSAVVAIAWDNTLIQDSLWEDHKPAPGGQWTRRANETHLKESSSTRATRLLLVCDEPRCEWLLEEGQAHHGLSHRDEPFALGRSAAFGSNDTPDAVTRGHYSPSPPSTLRPSP